MQHINIAIDGPAGAGKSTVARQVARELGSLYVDTGAMYRSVAWLAVQSGVDPTDETALLDLLREHSLKFDKSIDNRLDVMVDGESILDQLRDPIVSATVSELSVHRGVRAQLTAWQRDFARRYPVVMDGRDVGTVVLPDAPLKIFLTADLRARAERRAREFASQGFDVPVDELLSAIQERDLRDSSREVAPLRPADDAHLIDSTGKTVDDVVREILYLVELVNNEA